MKITSFYTNKAFIAVYTVLLSFNLLAQDSALTIEEVIVTAEKRSESLQDISQAITALSDSDIEDKNINSFVDLSAIVPGVTVAKNEGYKTCLLYTSPSPRDRG